MSLLDISFASGERSLSVRRIEVHEGVSTLFTATAWALSPHADIDLEPLVGQPAAIAAAGSHRRVWSGVVAHMEQVRGQGAGLGQKAMSTYVVRVVPRLWLLTQRQNHRIFQHLSVPDLTDKLLGEWGLTAEWKIDRGAYPKLEFEVQYGESDFAFLSRMWEEEGIAFSIPDSEEGKTVMLGDKLHEGPARAGDPIRFVDSPSGSERHELVTGVTLSHEVRPGARTHRDYDMRNPRFALFGKNSAAAAGSVEAQLEQYRYEPHGFLVEGGKGGGTPSADDRGVARHDEAAGHGRAQRHLEADRTGKVKVSFQTNVVDLVPGSRFSIGHHPHAGLDPATKLLVTDLTTHADSEGEWAVHGEAVKSDVPYRPALQTPRPKIHSVQTATVVGPPGEEIHTDEFGRVRVQFPWDREGQNDAGSSCWIRVAQGWGGTGYGMLVLPRIGQEVLVSFLDGEPDAPIIVGRVFNATEAVPYKLPDHKTRSTWKSDSSPGHGGFNEIMMEDLAGKELVYMQAQKNLRKLVKNDETITVGQDRQKYVLRDETETTGQDRQEVTGRDRTEITDRNRTTMIGGDRGKLIKGNEIEHTVQNLLQTVGGDHDVVTKGDKRERVEQDSHLGVGGDRSQLVKGTQSLTVGKDQQEVVKGNHALAAGGEIHFKAGTQIVIEAPDVTIAGAAGFVRLDSSGVVIKGNLVLINSGGSAGSGAGSHPAAPDAAKEAVVPEPERPIPDNVAISGLAQ